ncbi:MAG TPA: carboxymuconolactone decarboxylase family protein [Alphaproteobacteria bacterium]|nr:carboxymuconolactone decarboxylase family protein [Alphaproteobacteria bacterium]
MPTSGPDRLPPIPHEAQTAEQRAAVAETMHGPRGAFGGPFVPLLRTPELMTRIQRLGAYIRYSGAVPHRLRELAIAVTARELRQVYEWVGHAPLAQKLGVEPSALAELAKGITPKAFKPEERLIYDFCTALHRDHSVSDEVYERIVALFGETGVMELTVLCGYYVLIAMVLNVARTPMPPGTPDPFA